MSKELVKIKYETTYSLEKDMTVGRFLLSFVDKEIKEGKDYQVTFIVNDVKSIIDGLRSLSDLMSKEEGVNLEVV